MNFKEIGKEYGFQYIRHYYLYLEKEENKLAPFTNKNISPDIPPIAYAVIYKKYIAVFNQFLILTIKIPLKELELSNELTQEEIEEIQNIKTPHLQEIMEEKYKHQNTKKCLEKQKNIIRKYSDELLRCELEAIKRREEYHAKENGDKTENNIPENNTRDAGEN